MNERDKTELQKSLDYIAAEIPKFLFAFYNSCVAAGFSEDQAMFVMIRQFEFMHTQHSLPKDDVLASIFRQN